jgi:putative ABC transport system ATP-binding protein
MTIVETRNLAKIHGQGAAAVTALAGINLHIQAGEFTAIMGPSGCGKSTLLQLIGGLDRPTSGDVIIAGQGLAQLSDDALSTLRRRTIGFVFQAYNLIPVLNAAENVALPLLLDGMRQPEALMRAATWLERLGLADRRDHRPDQLSGGQQQRVAIARALVADPALILADEPTGNLDSKAAGEIAELLRKIAANYGRTILMVTHDPRIAAHAGRIIFLKDGTIADDSRIAERAAPGGLAVLAAEG